MNWKYLFCFIYGIPFILHLFSFIAFKCEIPLGEHCSMCSDTRYGICSDSYYGMKNDMLNGVVPLVMIFIIETLRKMKLEMYETDSMLLLYFSTTKHMDHFIPFFGMIYSNYTNHYEQ